MRENTRGSAALCLLSSEPSRPWNVFNRAISPRTKMHQLLRSPFREKNKMPGSPPKDLKKKKQTMNNKIMFLNTCPRSGLSYSLRLLHVRFLHSNADSSCKEVFWKDLQSKVFYCSTNVVFEGKNYAQISFNEPYPYIHEIEIITLAFYQLLELYVYVLQDTYVKITLGYRLKLDEIDYPIIYILGPAIPLYTPDGKRIPKLYTTRYIR